MWVTSQSDRTPIPRGYLAHVPLSLSTPKRALIGTVAVSLLMFAPAPSASSNEGSAGDGGAGEGGAGSGAAQPAAPTAKQIRTAALAQIRATAPTRQQLRRASAADLVKHLVRCVDLDGETFCLNLGFVDQSPAAVQRRVISAMRSSPVSQTGAMSMRQLLKIRAKLTPQERQEAEVTEVKRAVRSLGKIKWLGYVGKGKAPPESLFERYPKLDAVRRRAIARGGARRMARVARGRSVSHKIMRNSDARRQVRSYWCGPATMQMIDGGDDRHFESQLSWAHDLNTEAHGATAINDINFQINHKTRWDNRARRYRRVSVAGWSPDRFYRTVTHQTGFLGAPWVQHPSLDERWHAYLSAESHDYGGHFQVGRGYARRARDGQRFAHILEPFNEPDWTRYTKRTWGPRRIKLGNALRANWDNNAFQNIGL